ncbi:hypothetical protein [Aquibacillus salsiterrae]|uniref:Uncharacterized protein n=1 Tax=Aquibacillus salsiterrae TaxID=2950439 RepID=A0A9X3WDQ8_9BACI|nr:hypothetical protein [Aquibacillus salsiterrae]MDC3417977.1 hypothetical protein [Aquibacillus salsiterrae]
MKEPEYLLTFNASSYEWFHEYEEMVAFIKQNKLSNYEALHIPEAFELEIEE